MKVAQLLATIPDALPAGIRRRAGQLQAERAGDGLALRRAGAWRASSGRIGRRASGASSTRRRAPPRSGQVHRAVAQDGRRAGLQAAISRHGSSAVEADLQPAEARAGDLRALRPRRHHRRDPRRDRRAPARGTRLRARGRAHAALPRHARGRGRASRVPEPVPELSTQRLLTMTWLEGAPLLDGGRRRRSSERNEIARNMFRAWYVPFYCYGVIHGDPHLGNYTVRARWRRQSARFRLHPRFPRALRPGRDRPLSRARPRRRGARHPRL